MNKKMAAVIISVVAILSAFIFVANAANTTTNAVAEQPVVEETSTAGTCSMSGCSTGCSKCGDCGTQCAATGGCGCGCGAK